MIRIWTGAAGALLALATVAGAQDDAELVRKRDAKLAEPWLKAASWITDYDQALAESEKTGKPIFGYFTRSYSP